MGLPARADLVLRFGLEIAGIMALVQLFFRRPAGAHARWIEFPAGPVDTGLAANSRHPGQEYYDAENGIGQREERC